MDSIKLEELTQTRDRPLFSPSRRPWSPPAPPPPPPVAIVEAPPPRVEPPPFYLVGVVVGGDTRMVLLANRKDGSVSRLRQGDEQAGWRVQAIDVRSVVLERDGREESVALAGPAPSESAATAPKPAPASELAERQIEDGIAAGPVREEYKRLMKQLTAKR